MISLKTESFWSTTARTIFQQDFWYNYVIKCSKTPGKYIDVMKTNSCGEPKEMGGRKVSIFYGERHEEAKPTAYL